MKILIRVLILSTLLLTNLILFGQDLDTSVINKPTRYISGVDTFSVFKLKDERIIVYRLYKLNGARYELSLSKEAIIKADSVIKQQKQIIENYKLSDTNQRQQIEYYNKISSTYPAEKKLYQKQIKKKAFMVGVWKVASGILATALAYSLMFK